MSLTGTIKSAVRTGGSILGAFTWCVGTLWLGATGLWKGAWFLVHVRQMFSTTLRCPRGHVLEAFGPLKCGRCQAVFEGHVFDRCPSCGASVRFVACPRCHLAVRNRLT
jgi:hypothetical protein